jgi:hypothetical protein
MNLGGSVAKIFETTAYSIYSLTKYYLLYQYKFLQQNQKKCHRIGGTRETVTGLCSQL